MLALEGNALLYSVCLLASLGFLLIGYDNVSPLLLYGIRVRVWEATNHTKMHSRVRPSRTSGTVSCVRPN